MPYVQASPRVRAGYAAPVFSAFAFLVAAGLSLEGSPFCARTQPVEARPPVIFDPSLAGVYDTTWGVIALDADGTARGRHQRGASADAFDVVGRWRMTHEAGAMIHFEWATGSYAAAREWWKPNVAPWVATCEGGNC